MVDTFIRPDQRTDQGTELGAPRSGHARIWTQIVACMGVSLVITIGILARLPMAAQTLYDMFVPQPGAQHFVHAQLLYERAGIHSSDQHEP